MNHVKQPINFELIEKVPVFNVVINDQKKRFILDSGASCLILNSRYEENDGMRFVFHDLNTPGMELDGLLGYELFCKQKALIRFGKRELLLQTYE